MARATNIRMGVRLALLESDAAPTALVFESASASEAALSGRGGGGGGPDSGGGRSVSASAGSANGKSIFLPADPLADVTVRELDLQQTLLSSAVRGGCTGARSGLARWLAAIALGGACLLVDIVAGAP